LGQIGATEEMKTIIAGGREYIPRVKDIKFLNSIKDQITEVVSGCQRGGDAFGEWWAEQNHIPVKKFPADWDLHHKSAGPIRNRQMAMYADAAVLLPGGPGTNNMFNQATELDLVVYDRRQL